MYLISIYFDEKTENRISGYMKQIAKRTGNMAMLDGNVPPHITVSAFGAESEEEAIAIFEQAASKISRGKIQWVSAAAFFPRVIYILPVLNAYLHQISEITYKEVTQLENVKLKGHYEPFAWIPHGTLAKHLTKEQMKCAFGVMQEQFVPFESKVVKIGLAHTNPYENIMIRELK